MRKIGLVFAAITLGLSLAACTPTYTGQTVNGQRALEPIAVDDGPSVAEIEQAQREAFEEVVGREWNCWYDVTYNENWHDDVRCTDGVSSHRPTLLPGQFVTEADMRAEAARYEAYLNSGGEPIE